MQIYFFLNGFALDLGGWRKYQIAFKPTYCLKTPLVKRSRIL
ncbi:hypothetical protein L3N51_01849 [Metallosphaera sp. J1]|nr:hypothetical protein [Metallosphaera javensis (ex Hofmann et al. 2022)]BCS94109.1 MAG: hypothetical protein MjAS7_2717 [Metallosphaera javensis (ex Sakai et al. 2022)]